MRGLNDDDHRELQDDTHRLKEFEVLGEKAQQDIPQYFRTCTKST